MVIFSMLGALDRIFGCRFGIGKEFEKGFQLLGTMALSMIGMIILSPLIAEILSPVFDFVSNRLHLDPSIIPASLFANDMGGAPLSVEISKTKEMGLFNGLVVSSMMGCTISFTIPVALGMVVPQKQQPLLLGFLCGIVTIPVGCFVSGLLLKLPFLSLISNLLILILFSVVIALGLFFCPSFCVKIFSAFGAFIKILITIGLAFGILEFLLGIRVHPSLATLQEGADICLNASIVMSGAFPLMFLVSKVLSCPLKKLASLLEINEASAMGFLSSLATSLTTYGAMDRMDEKGILLNSAFAISAAFSFAGHLAFTLAYDAGYLIPVIIGKLISGLAAVLLAMLIYKRTKRRISS